MSNNSKVISENPPTAWATPARNSSKSVRVVVVCQLLPLFDVPRCQDPDRVADDVDITVGMAGVIDVSRDIATDGRVARPAAIDCEDPDALVWQVAELPLPGFYL